MDRTRNGSEYHLPTDPNGVLLVVTLTGTDRHDVTQFLPLVGTSPIVRGVRGRPRLRYLSADRGDDHDIYRRALRARGITPCIARRGVLHSSGLGRIRWVVERGFAWLHQLKRLRTRYGARADLRLGLLQLACASICYRELPTSS
ncbi:transposase [Kineococcus aurantiacus]|uniref:Transposase n=1 Tax=Kineococcus aurantiacus TaxID=37633 RepID=A0A7Y9DQT4_9ACTN|nr:transposase [Kineococcus aurantiacus]